MDLTIHIPPDQSDRVIDAVSSAYGYQPMVGDALNEGAVVTNPQTKPDFVKSVLIDFLLGIVARSETDEAMAVAARDAKAAVDQEITLS